MIPARDCCSPGFTTTKAPTLCWVIYNQNQNITKTPKRYHLKKKGKWIYTYGFNSVVNSVISGTPKPRPISTFAFGLHDVRDGRALEPMLLHTRSLSRLGARAKHRRRLNRWVDHTEMLQQRGFHNVSTGHKRTNRSLHLLPNNGFKSSEEAKPDQQR